MAVELLQAIALHEERDVHEHLVVRRLAHGSAERVRLQARDDALEQRRALLLHRGRHQLTELDPVEVGGVGGPAPQALAQGSQLRPLRHHSAQELLLRAYDLEVDLHGTVEGPELLDQRILARRQQLVRDRRLARHDHPELHREDAVRRRDLLQHLRVCEQVAAAGLDGPVRRLAHECSQRAMLDPRDLPPIHPRRGEVARGLRPHDAVDVSLVHGQSRLRDRARRPPFDGLRRRELLVRRRRGRSSCSSSSSSSFWSSSSSSSLENRLETLSFAPSSAPFVFFLAPPSRRSSSSSGRPSASSDAAMSRRLTASAKRRYVSTLATTIRASTTSSSMPTSETRTYRSMTRPLSRI